MAAQADKWVCGRYVTIRRSLSVNAHEWIAVACQLLKGEYRRMSASRASADMQAG